MNIPITKTYFDNCEKEMIVKPLESGWVVQGHFVKEFESMFAEFCGVKYAVATSNCTTALHLALIGLGIKEGDKVLVPSFTYIASANAIEYVGAIPVFCDIDIATFNIDTTGLRNILNSDDSIKAIMPINLFGLCANLPKIMEIAKEYNLKVIEDSACGFDSRIAGKHSGTFGDCGCFSFHPRKSICTGEGGMLITNNEELANTVSKLRDHGASKTDLERHQQKGSLLLPEFKVRGYNYRMTDIQGALGVCQMKKQNYIMQKRRELARKYDEALTDISSLVRPYTPENYLHGYQSYVCLFTNGKNLENITIGEIEELGSLRDELMLNLEARGISTRQGTHAVHVLEYYKTKYALNDGDYLMSYAGHKLSITLPLYVSMTDEEFEYVVDNIKRLTK